MPGHVVVRMFGPLELQFPGGCVGVRDLGGVKPKQLLELLLLARGRTVPKDRIADGLWGEALPQGVAATIESYVSVLRNRLDDGTGLGRRLITTDRGGYRLVSEFLDVEVDRTLPGFLVEALADLVTASGVGAELDEPNTASRPPAPGELTAAAAPHPRRSA